MKKFTFFLFLLSLGGVAVYLYYPELESRFCAKKGKITAPAQEPLPAPIPLPKGDAAPAPADKPAPEIAASPLPFPESPATQEKAKEENKPSLIIWHGSDWLPGTDKIVRTWTQLAKEELPVIIGQFDERLGYLPGEHPRQRQVSYGGCYELPIAVLSAPDGTYLASWSGKRVYSVSGMKKGVERALKRMPDFMSLVERARNTKGTEAAMAAGEALSMLSLHDAMRHRELRDILNKQDPDHDTGYRYLYGMDHMGMYEEINAVLNGGKGSEATLKGADRRFDEAEQFIRNILKQHKDMHRELRQQWLSGLAYVYRERYWTTKDEAWRTKLLKTYRRVAKIDPETEYGKGAEKLCRYWDPEYIYVIRDGFYDNSHNALRMEKEWCVDVTRNVKSPGRYEFSIVPTQGGRLDARDFRLFINGRMAGRPLDAEEDTITRNVTFQVDGPIRGRVEVRLRVTTHDHWFGCSGKLEMKALED